MSKLNLTEPPLESPIIATYRRIAYVSESMREAALRERWDDLLRLGRDYLEAVNELKKCPGLSEFSPEERRARAKLLLEIIDNDAIIRDLAQPEMARVGRLISRFSRNKVAIRAYHQSDPS